MDEDNSNRKDEIQVFQTLGGLNAEPAAPHFADTTCKIEKEWNLSWTILYQSFSIDVY